MILILIEIWLNPRTDSNWFIKNCLNQSKHILYDEYANLYSRDVYKQFRCLKVENKSFCYLTLHERSWKVFVIFLIFSMFQ